MDVPEQRGFRDGADLRLGAIDSINVNRKERERETLRKVPSSSNISKYIEKRVRMHGNA